jgi:hypothetical protein
MTESASSTREKVLRAIREHPGIDRERLLALTGMTSGVMDPSRIRLWEAGMIEPNSSEGWEEALANRVKRVGWRVVEDPGARARVAARAKERKRRNAVPSAEERAASIVEQLDDPTVNRLVHEMTKGGAGSKKAQREATKAMRARHLDRKQQAARAERDKVADAEFKRILAHLWDARGVVGSVDAHLIEERARVANGERRRISDHDWAVALRDIREIVKSFGEMWQNVRDLGSAREPCPACGAPQLDDVQGIGAFAIDVDGEYLADDDEVDAQIVDTRIT